MTETYILIMQTTTNLLPNMVMGLFPLILLGLAIGIMRSPEHY